MSVKKAWWAVVPLILVAAVIMVVGGSKQAAEPVPGADTPKGLGAFIDPVGVRRVMPITLLRVVDGDTVDVGIQIWSNISVSERIRFEVIDTYELHSRNPDERVFALKAKEYVKKVLGEHEHIYISTQVKRGSFGRLLGTLLYKDEKGYHSVSDELMKLGLARLYRR